MDFTLDYMDFTLGYTGIHVSDWSEVQPAQSCEIAHRGILIRDASVLSWGGGGLLGDVSTVNQGTLSAPLLQYILEYTAIVVLF